MPIAIRWSQNYRLGELWCVLFWREPILIHSCHCQRSDNSRRTNRRRHLQKHSVLRFQQRQLKRCMRSVASHS